MLRLAIVGAGFSGTALAIQLLRRSDAGPFRLHLIEKQPAVGKGVAFGTVEDSHLLNVPANDMSLYPEDNAHFLKWLRAEGHEYGEKDFVPRKVFADYLQSEWRHCLAEADTSRFSVLRDEVMDIVPMDGEVRLQLASGGEIPADKVIFAWGNIGPAGFHHQRKGLLATRRYHPNPWAAHVLGGMRRDENVLFVGTGLTMVDMICGLEAQLHRGRVMALSRHGFLPEVFPFHRPYHDFSAELEGITEMGQMLHIVKQHRKKALAAGYPPHSVVKSLRNATQRVWTGLPLAEKRKFLHHLRPFWDAARHNMPESSAELLSQWQRRGQLEVLAARILDFRIGDDAIEVVYHNKGRREDSAFRAAHVINCMGPETRYDEIEMPLVQNLLRRGLIRPDTLHAGLDALPDGSVISNTGEASRQFFTLGPPLKGILWETTAVPEIRVQAEKLAGRLVEVMV